MRLPRSALALLALVLAGPALVLGQEEPLAAGSEGVPVPKKKKHVQPVYPPEALAQGIRGIVILDLVIDTEGRVAETTIIRSIPGLDEAALAAAQQWVYEPVEVDGKPVSVRLTVPITFALKLPEMTRQTGIPELRQGVTPPWPTGATGGGEAVASVTLEPDGRIGLARMVEGEEPWSTSLLQALRTWRFRSLADNVLISFRVEAEFRPEGPEKGDVELHLTGLNETTTFDAPAEVARSEPGPAEVPAPEPARPQESPAEPDVPRSEPATPEAQASEPSPAAPEPVAQPQAPEPPSAAPEPPSAAPEPSSAAPEPPSAAPEPPSAAPEPSSAAPEPVAQPQAPEPPPSAAPRPEAQPEAPAPPSTATQPRSGDSEAAAAPPSPTPAAEPPGPAPPTTVADAAPASADASGAGATSPPAQTTSLEGSGPPPPPPVEVLTAPPPPLPPENGVSAIRGVELEPGVPDLTRGRRPVSPPFARMARASGVVSIDFSVSAGGVTAVQRAEGPEVFKPAAVQAVESWVFRRTRADRAYLTAVFTYEDDLASAVVRPQPAP